MLFNLVSKASVKSFADRPLPVTEGSLASRAACKPDILLIPKLSNVLLLVFIKSTTSCDVGVCVPLYK